MIIDVKTKEDPIMRYLADFMPNVGDTISTIDGTNTEWKVVAVDQLVRTDPSNSNIRRLQLITVTVE